MRRTLLYISFLSIVSGFLITSCDTDRFPMTVVSDGNFWNSESDLKMAVNRFYRMLPGGAPTGGVGDTSDSYTSDTSYATREKTANNTAGSYGYGDIYQANNVLEKEQIMLDKGIDATILRSYMGEVRFFRAWRYFEMLKSVGGVPLITRTLTPDDTDEIYKPRASREEILDFIYQDLEYAANNCRTPEEIEKAEEYGRITNTAAMAYMARVALYEGTRAKYHGYGNPTPHLTRARDYALQVMNTGFHTLYSTPQVGPNGENLNDAYYNLFQEVSDGHREMIIARVHGVDVENSYSSHSTPRAFESGGPSPTQNFVDRYLMADGLPYNKSPLYTAPTNTTKYNEYFDKRDPRMSFTILKTGDEHQLPIGAGNFTLPHTNFNRTGYAIRLYANPVDHQRQQSFIDIPVLRYAEVLLTYAEAVYELNGSISDADLDITINLLRARLPDVNIGTEASPDFKPMAKLTNALVNANSDVMNMRDEIRRERRIELAFQGLSWDDLNRWYLLHEELPQDIRGAFVNDEMKNGTGSYNWKPRPVGADGYLILQKATARDKFIKERDYLRAIPVGQIIINPAITQNPGWE